MSSRMLRVLRDFFRAEEAVVAIQVTIFSVMLLTSAGLVIDFGRAYSAHSNMQGFVDKAALAAATELNGQDDAISRATAAAQAVTQTSSFIDGNTTLEVALPLTFFSRDPSTSSAGFDPSNPSANEFATTDPSEAAYVYVEAAARTIELTLMNVGLNPEVTNNARLSLIENGYNIRDLSYTDASDLNAIPVSEAADEMIAQLEGEGMLIGNEDGTYSLAGSSDTALSADQLNALVAGAIDSAYRRGQWIENDDDTVTTNAFSYDSPLVSADVRTTLAELTDENGAISQPSSISLEAYAVAKLETSYCGPLSTLVMCNPFEGSDQTFAEIMDGQEGARMLLTAEILSATGEVAPLNHGGDEIRLGLLANPWDEIGGDPTGVCAEDNLSAFTGPAYEPNAAGTESDPRIANPVSTEQLRDMCYLATIDAGLQCIGSEVLVEPADPETITTALNTIFDIWDAPMDRVLNQNVTSDRDFAPDYVSVHGKMTREEANAFYTEMRDLNEAAYYQHQAEMDAYSAAYYAADVAGDTEARDIALENYRTSYFAQNDANISYTYAVAKLDEAQSNYPANIRNSASRRNFVPGEGYGNAWGPMLLGDSCLDTRSSDPRLCEDGAFIDLPRTSADSLENGTYNEVSAPYPAVEVEYPEVTVTVAANNDTTTDSDGDTTAGNNGNGGGLGNPNGNGRGSGNKRGNNGWGNGDQCAPGNSLDNNNAENSDTVHHIHGEGNPDDCPDETTVTEGGSDGGDGTDTTGGTDGGTTGSTETAGSGDTTDLQELTYAAFSLGQGTDGGIEVAGWTIVNNSTEDESIYISFRDTDEEEAPAVTFILNVPGESAIDFQTTFIYDINVTWENGEETFAALYDGDFSGLDGSTDVAAGLVPTFSSYFAVYYNPYENANGIDLNRPSSTLEWDIAGASSLYDGYRTVERAYSELLDASASSGGEQIQTLPRNYQFSTDPSIEQTSERRMQRVTLVNCGALREPVSVEGYADNPDYEGAYLAQVQGVVDLFLTRDVEVAACATMQAEGDVMGAIECWNSQIERAYVHVEYQGIEAPMNPDAEEYLAYAILVE